MMLPGVPPGPFIRYIVRTEPGRAPEVMRQVEEQLAPLNDTRMLRKFEPYTEIVARSYQRDHSMTVLLMCTVFLLVSITSLGIVGLASFAARQRTKQIGTRRAIGATRLDIMRYFMVENWLVTSIGVVAGAVLAVGFNMWLVDTYELEKLNWLYLPLGMVALWIIGQLAVLVPAIRAANIAPAIATRTV
jgi:putative ABC transport system permease protein